MFKGSVRIGQFFGIQLRLHYSWFFIFAYVTYILSAFYFPTTYPDWHLSVHIAAGLLTSLLYFSSVVIHELSHSLVASRAQIGIKSITLFFLGGIAEMEKEPQSAGAEFRVAIAGPLSSLLLGAVFLAVFFGIGSTENAGWQFVAAVAYYIGYINVILAVFNLIPGFPMDGGRVFRSIIWAVTRNRQKSTRIAASIGRVFGYAFIAFGVFQIFTNNLSNGIWLVLIGWFLESSAINSYSQTVIEEKLNGHTAKEIMTEGCRVIPPGLPLNTFVEEVLLKSDQRCFPIGTDDRTDGLVTLSDIKAIPRDEWALTPISRAMTPFENVKTVSPDEDLRTVLRIMAENDINQVPVVEGHLIVGMISRNSLINFIHI